MATAPESSAGFDADSSLPIHDFGVPPTTAVDRSPPEGDTCRICRSEGTDNEPLFYPCKCSGSIKFVHQDCLMEWLSHSNKKHCELCKTPFRFTKLYDSHMPRSLPLHIFFRKAALHTLRYLLTWIRALAVAFVWLLALPWCIRWSWRGLFWLLDAGWARDAWLAKVTHLSFNSTSLHPAALLSSAASSSDPAPITLNLSKLLIGALLNPWHPFSATNDVDPEQSAAILTNAARSTLLSQLSAVNSLTSSASLNRFILDVLEGQIVTFLIVVAFILVFLIREWVVQQQPIINAAAQLRDAEMHVNVADLADQLQRHRQHQALQQHLVGARNQLDAAAAAAIGHALEHDAVFPEALEDTIYSDSDSDSVWSIESGHASHEHAEPMAANEAASPAPARPPTDQEDSIRRPFMHHRDSLADLGELSGTNNDQEATPNMRSDAVHREDVPSDSSAGSWQSIGGFASNDPSPRPPPHAPDAEHSETQPVQYSEPTVYVPQTVENGFAQTPQVPDNHLAPTEPTTESSNAAQERPQSPGPADPLINPENHAPADGNAPAESSPTRREAPAPQNETAIKGLVEHVFDWFWADIVPDGEDAEQNPVDPFDEVIMRNEADEAPFVRFNAGNVDPDPVQPDNVRLQDPEVLQAAAEAGLDADAMDDAEDLDGILELIGMQGPIVGLLQTAMFCAVLITTTLWAALGMPYLFGKLALLFLGDPIVFLIMAPLKFVSLVADGIVDSTIYVGGVVTYLAAEGLSVVSTWICRALSMNAGNQPLTFLTKRAHGAITAAGNRLSTSFSGENPFETGFLMVSLHAHQSLQTLQLETAKVTAFTLRLAAAASGHLQSSSAGQMSHALLKTLKSEISQAGEYYAWIHDLAQRTFAANVGNGTLTFTVTRESTRVDPLLAYWSATDRFITILVGYAFLAMIGTAYLLRTEPLFSSPSLQRIEKSFTDFLKQAGGVLKVILIISIEMLVFPLYCGLLLDFALLPLFEQATVGSRLLYAAKSPWLFAFVHWFIGTCYMFHFALFVSACRRTMRSGVLYFIRDPDDPTFHPVRDVLERNVVTQLRKIAFSALVYGGLVICCLGGVVWGIDRLFRGTFPIRWATPEPVLEFPIDFLIYNLIAPVVVRFLLPSDGFELLFKTWLKHCARGLRLSHFLFGERREDEEGHRVRKTPSNSSEGDQSGYEIVRDGRYVRAPASDQVRIPKGNPVFLEVTENDERIDGGPDHATGIHGSENSNFAKVYVPPWFRVRITLFMTSLWLFAAATGVGITVVPMAFGRTLLSALIPAHVEFNDLYAFSAGLLILGSSVYLLARTQQGLRSVQSSLSLDTLTGVVANIKSHFTRLVKSIYVYGFALVVVPTLFALALQLYLIMPLHTYTASWSANSTNTTTAGTTSHNTTVSFIPTPFSSSAETSPVLAGHTIHILQDWTLGFLYGRVVLRLLTLSRNSRPATALRLITRDGYTNPNAALATRAFVAPTILLFTLILLVPPMLASLASQLLIAINFPSSSIFSSSFFGASSLSSSLSFPIETMTVKAYRYSYPICASQAFIVWGVWELVRATRAWRGKIKDEVYLIGERLHNFGDKRPPLSSNVQNKGGAAMAAAREQ